MNSKFVYGIKIKDYRQIFIDCTITYYLDWTENSYCPSSFKMEEYDNLSEALHACRSNSSCKIIVDYECDNEEFWTCSEGKLPSAIGSCTYQDTQGINDNILSHLDI